MANNKVRFNVSKVLEFNNTMEMVYFLIKYQDLFKPFCEDTAKSEANYISPIAGNLAREFGVRSWYKESTRIVVNFRTKEDFAKVESLFEKKHLRRGTNMFLYKGAE